jgi:type IV pilus assembly protein PilA
MAEAPKKGSRPEIIMIGVVLACFCLFGVAVSLPMHLRFSARSKQSECKYNLKQIFTAEKAYFGEHDRYTTSAKDLDFHLERGNRYGYLLGDVLQPDLQKFPKLREVSASDVPFPVGVFGKCPDCTFVGACAGNLDDDPTLDVWSTSTADRTMPSGENVPSGTPYNDVNDLER